MFVVESPVLNNFDTVTISEEITPVAVNTSVYRQFERLSPEYDWVITASRVDNGVERIKLEPKNKIGRILKHVMKQ